MSVCLESPCNSVPKYQNKFGKSGTLVLARSRVNHQNETSCLPSTQTHRTVRKQIKETKEKRNSSSSSWGFSIQELKMDSWRNAFMACVTDCSHLSNTWDSFNPVGHSDGATNTRPLQEEKIGKRWRQRRMGVVGICCLTMPKESERRQKMVHNRPSFGLLWMTNNQLCFTSGLNRVEPLTD